MIGKLMNLFRGMDGQWVLSISTPSDPREMFDKMKDKLLDISIKQHRKKRSLDANAYCWVLVGEIAKEMNLPKNEVYRKAIIDSGVFTVHCVPNNQLDQAVEDWESFGLGFQTEQFPSKTPGCTNVVFYKGSSFYDTTQMSRLISGLIHEAECLGIHTISKEEEQRMLGEWRRGGKKDGDSEGEDSSVSA